MDEYDPYRLAPRQPDRIDLPFYRPDQDLTAGGPDPNPNFLGGVRASLGSPIQNIRVAADGRLRVLESADVDGNEEA